MNTTQMNMCAASNIAVVLIVREAGLPVRNEFIGDTKPKHKIEF